MLVLSRQKFEEVYVCFPGQQPVVVSVVDIRGDKVRLGFDAPREVPVHRREVYEAIERQREIDQSDDDTQIVSEP